MRYQQIEDNIYNEIIESVEGLSANALWGFICRRIFGTTSVCYEDRKQFFLSIMYRLMKEGRLKLANKGKFLKGTIEEQVEQYSEQWPKDESLLDRFDFQLIDVDGILCYWAEGGFVWIYEDGFEEWT